MNDGMDKEIAELKGFISELKTDRAAQKDKEKREAWTKYTSMSLVIIAVLMAIATQWSGKYSSRTLVQLNNATLKQATASDQWGEFQANSIKQNLYESIHDLTVDDPSKTPEDAAKREAVFKAKIEKYMQGKEKTKKEATDLQKEKDEALVNVKNSAKHGSEMGLAGSLYQISIAMGSICLVAKKKWLWYVSLLLATLATYQMISVWLMA